VYAAIVLRVFIAYRDLRAVVACCLSLTVGTFIGYWFTKVFEIGLTVARLPVMVLAVSICVDYAFYIYNRLQGHLAAGEPIVKALEHSILEVGMATNFTAITLAIGVATWSFSALKFQRRHGSAPGVHVHRQSRDGNDRIAGAGGGAGAGVSPPQTSARAWGAQSLSSRGACA
jgi:predicted RND superfamily exporter protein